MNDRMRVPFADLGLLHEPLKAEISRAIDGVIERNAFIGGAEIEGFECEFAAFCGGGAAAAVGNGTDAIMLALIAAGINAGDEVILPAQSFIATAEPVITLGARPILVDVDEGACLIDCDQLEAAITERTRAIMPVHLYGQPADMGAINALARKHGLKVIEDAAQAHGASYGGVRTGLLGDVAAFSFYPGKNLGAYGDAGCVTSDNLEWIERVRSLRNHGRSAGRKFEHDEVGYNCRMDTLQAAILTIKLRHLESWTENRRVVARRYDELLAGVVKTPKLFPGREHVFHLYVIQLDRRDEVREKLRERGISTGVHYPHPIHQHSGFKIAVGDQSGQFPVAERAARRILSLPIFPGISDEEIEYVAYSLKDIIENEL